MRILTSLLVLLHVSAGVGKAQQPVVLWPNGAPGSEGKTDAEVVRLTEQGEHIVSRVHRPSITPYLPTAATATGAAVVVIPGGGHRELWMDHEGYRVGQWLSDHGVAAFVLDCRLLSAGNITHKVFVGAAASPRDQGETSLIDNHLLLVVPVSASGVPISVELWPTPVSQTMGFLGCDLSAIE